MRYLHSGNVIGSRGVGNKLLGGGATFKLINIRIISKLLPILHSNYIDLRTRLTKS